MKNTRFSVTSIEKKVRVTFYVMFGQQLGKVQEKVLFCVKLLMLTFGVYPTLLPIYYTSQCVCYFILSSESIECNVNFYVRNLRYVTVHKEKYCPEM